MKESDIAYIDLSNAIRWDNEDLLAKALSNKRLDLTYDNGKLFNLSLDVGDVKIVKMLISYFFDNPPDKYKQNEFIPVNAVLKKQLHDILEIAIEDVSLSEEMKELLSEYTTSYEDDSSDTDKEQDSYEEDGSRVDISKDNGNLDSNFSTFPESAIEMYNEGNRDYCTNQDVLSWLNQIPPYEASMIGEDNHFTND